MGSDPLVGTNSEVYFAYHDFNDATLKFATSTDGGRTFGVDVKICDAAYLYVVPHTTFPTNSYPFLAIDRTNGPYVGNLYSASRATRRPGRAPTSGSRRRPTAARPGRRCRG